MYNPYQYANEDKSLPTRQYIKHTIKEEDESLVTKLSQNRTCLKVLDYLSDYREDWQKQKVRDNLGVTQQITSTERRILDKLNKEIGILNLSKFDNAEVKQEGTKVYITFFSGKQKKQTIEFITESTPVEDIERLIRDIIEETSTWEKGAGEHSVQTKGTECLANGDYSVAEGQNARTNHSGRASHAEGSGTIASGVASHVEGNTSESKADYSHAEGGSTISDGVYSHTEGEGTVTNNIAEHAEGRFNKSHSYKDGDLKDTIHSIGIGTSMSNRQNAVEVMQNGDVYINGVGEYDGVDIENANTLQEVIENKQDTLVSGTSIKTINNESILGSGNVDLGKGIKVYKATDKIPPLISLVQIMYVDKLTGSLTHYIKIFTGNVILSPKTICPFYYMRGQELRRTTQNYGVSNSATFQDLLDWADIHSVEVLDSSSIIDNFESTAIDKALSAAKGKDLNDRLQNKTNLTASQGTVNSVISYKNALPAMQTNFGDGRDGFVGIDDDGPCLIGKGRAYVGIYADMENNGKAEVSGAEVSIKGNTVEIEGQVTLNEEEIVTEAPSDNKQYARKNKTWVEVQGGGGGADPEAVHFTPQTLTEAQKEQARANIADTTCRPFGRNMYPEEFVHRDGSHALDTYGAWNSGSSTFIFKITKKHDRVRETYNRAFVCDGWDETGLINPVAFSGAKELTDAEVGKYIAVCHVSGYNGPMFSVYGENVWFEDDLTDKEIQAELDIIHSLYRPNEYKFNALTSVTTTMYISPLIDCNGNTIRHVMGGCDDELGNQAWRYMVKIHNMQYANHCNLLLRHYVQRYNTSGVTSMYCAFSNCRYLEIADLHYLDMSSVTSCEFMFNGCSSLTTLDVSGWNVGAVTSMQSMFSGCSSLTTLIGCSHDLTKVALNGLNSNLGLNATGIDRASLRAVINGLADRTGQTQLTLTLGKTLKAKLTDEDILIATNKNWRIA